MVHYLHNSGCCRRSVAPWITVVSQHTVFTKLLWCDIPWNKAPHTQAHITSGALTHIAISLAMRRTQAAVELGGWFCWPVLVLASRVAQHLLCPHLVFQPFWGWGNLGSFQLLLSNSIPEAAWNLSGYI